MATPAPLAMQPPALPSDRNNRPPAMPTNPMDMQPPPLPRSGKRKRWSMFAKVGFGIFALLLLLPPGCILILCISAYGSDDMTLSEFKAETKLNLPQIEVLSCRKSAGLREDMYELKAKIPPDAFDALVRSYKLNHIEGEAVSSHFVSGLSTPGSPTPRICRYTSYTMPQGECLDVYKNETDNETCIIYYMYFLYEKHGASVPTR